MELEKDYKIARRGKFLRLQPPGYDENTYFRLGSKLGEAYTEEAIRDRIEHPENAYKYQTVISKGTSRRYVYKPNPNKINLIIDISKNIKARESLHYGQALVRSNINTLVKTMNFLIKNNLTTTGEFANYYNSQMDTYENCGKMSAHMKVVSWHVRKKSNSCRTIRSIIIFIPPLCAQGHNQIFIRNMQMRLYHSKHQKCILSV